MFLVFCDELNEFNEDTEIFTLADVLSKLVNLLKFEPLTTFNASILIC